MENGYRTQSRDTSLAIERMLVEAWRRMSPREKAERVASLTRACNELALAGISQRHPGASKRELQLRLAAFRLPREVMIRLFDWDPAREGYG